MDPSQLLRKAGEHSNSGLGGLSGVQVWTTRRVTKFDSEGVEMEKGQKLFPGVAT